MTAIIVLALVALFIGLQLYRVLGERTGHEQPLVHPGEAEQGEAAPPPQPRAGAAQARPVVDGDDFSYVPLAGPGVRALLAADPSFDVARFLDGAKSAYRLILESFWKGDLAALRPYVDGHVYDTFAGAVEERGAQGLSLDNRLVAVDHAVIVGAEVEQAIAQLTVRFEADIAAVTRNTAGDVVAGSLSDAVQTRDRWTFRRDLSANDPNWILIETDEEE